MQMHTYTHTHVYHLRTASQQGYKRILPRYIQNQTRNPQYSLPLQTLQLRSSASAIVNITIIIIIIIIIAPIWRLLTIITGLPVHCFLTIILVILITHWGMQVDAVWCAVGHTCHATKTISCFVCACVCVCVFVCVCVCFSV